LYSGGRAGGVGSWRTAGWQTDVRGQRDGVAVRVGRVVRGVELVHPSCGAPAVPLRRTCSSCPERHAVPKLDSIGGSGPPGRIRPSPAARPRSSTRPAGPPRTPGVDDAVLEAHQGCAGAGGPGDGDMKPFMPVRRSCSRPGVLALSTQARAARGTGCSAQSWSTRCRGTTKGGDPASLREDVIG